MKLAGCSSTIDNILFSNLSSFFIVIFSILSYRVVSYLHVYGFSVKVAPSIAFYYYVDKEHF